MTGPEPDPDRLKALEARLRAARGKDGRVPSRTEDHLTQAQAGWRMVTELLAGIGIGFALGSGLDSLLGTLPVFLVLMTLLGFAAGVKVMLRTAAEITAQNERAAARQKDGPEPGGD